jgi:hypothetical protein
MQPGDKAPSELRHCQHASLRFGCGGFYIFCASGCKRTWVAKMPGGAEPATVVDRSASEAAIGSHEVREKPSYQR